MLREIDRGTIAAGLGAAISLAVVRIGGLVHLTATEALLLTLGIALVVWVVLHTVPPLKKRLNAPTGMRRATLKTDDGELSFDYSTASGSVVTTGTRDGVPFEIYRQWGDVPGGS